MSLHVLYSFPTRLGVPGIGTTAWHQVQGLADLGVRVTLFCGSVERPLRGVERIVETMKFGPVPFSYRAIGLDRAMAWHDRRVAKALRRTAGDVNIVHCWPSGALRTLQVARECGIASALERPSSHTAEVYDVAQRESARLGVPLGKQQYANFNAPRLAKEETEFRLAQYLLCPSEAAAKTFRDRGFADGCLRKHRYGFDPKAFWPSLDPRNKSRSLHALFVGLCSPLKGLHIALDAWCSSEAAKDGTFTICGEFVEGYRDVLVKRLAHPSVRMLGFRRDVADIMRQCDILIHPSLSEGSALVTYEAQACGLIPLVSDAAGAQCSHLDEGLVHAAGDLGTLRKHINLLVADPVLRKQLQSRVLNHLPELTWSAAARRLVEIYTEANGNVHLRPPHGAAAQNSIPNLRVAG